MRLPDAAWRAKGHGWVHSVRGVAIAVSVAVVTIGCGTSGDVLVDASQAGPGQGTAVVPSDQTTIAVESTSEAATPSTAPVTSRPSVEVVAEIEQRSDDLLISDEIRGCVEQRASRVPRGTQPPDPIADATSRCRRLEVFGEPFLAAISGRTGDLDEEKRRCLTDGL